ncbi:MAG: hypothetical protein BYD32DRAFT_436332 [Podila humilis]|nr:MAG: hypothetical protein BYD32DRAFT_436332 [Podila humilis]
MGLVGMSLLTAWFSHRRVSSEQKEKKDAKGYNAFQDNSVRSSVLFPSSVWINGQLGHAPEDSTLRVQNLPKRLKLKKTQFDVAQLIKCLDLERRLQDINNLRTNHCHTGKYQGAKAI